MINQKSTGGPLRKNQLPRHSALFVEGPAGNCCKLIASLASGNQPRVLVLPLSVGLPTPVTFDLSLEEKLG